MLRRKPVLKHFRKRTNEPRMIFMMPMDSKRILAQTIDVGFLPLPTYNETFEEEVLVS